MLCYLLTDYRRAIGRSELVGVLWPSHLPKHPYADLRPVLSRIRHALGPDRLLGKEQLRVILPFPVKVDIEEAFHAVEAARSAARSFKWPDVDYWATTVLELLRSEFLPGQRGEWIEIKRRDLDVLRLEALEWKARSGIALGREGIGNAERAGRELVRRSPYRETGYRLLIEALSANGNEAEALRLYERMRHLLRREIGVSPAPELQALHLRLLAGRRSRVSHVSSLFDEKGEN